MFRFSLARLFLASLMVAVGIALAPRSIAAAENVAWASGPWFLAGVLYGAGLGLLYKNPLKGAVVGAVTGVVTQYLILIVAFVLSGDAG
jgi:uncharacterized membrane protein